VGKRSMPTTIVRLMVFDPASRSHQRSCSLETRTWFRPRTICKVLFLLVFLLISCRSAPKESKPNQANSSETKVVSPLVSATVSPKTGSRTRLVFLSAPWCQWCRVFEKRVLIEKDVQALISKHYRWEHINVDESPTWLDKPDVQGLPSLVFFDQHGKHILTRSGYRSHGETIDLLNVMAKKIATGDVSPYQDPKPHPVYSNKALSQEQGKACLKKWESAIFMKINSNDGGFGTPARIPYPDLMVALRQWEQQGAPKRVSSWVDLTLKHALRGRSPRLDGKQLPDFTYTSRQLQSLAKGESTDPQAWYVGVRKLADSDPFQGLQDPIDYGLFRYDAGPGWYHPHFERGALDNLAWILVLREEKRTQDAIRIQRFVQNTFVRGKLMAAIQVSNPFYYRLTAMERKHVPKPEVEEKYFLKVQARAARVWPERCSLLLRVDPKRWPRSQWTQTQELSSSEQATPDAVGELLLALADCQGNEYQKTAKLLLKTVLDTWKKDAHDLSGSVVRLHRLVAGICHVDPKECGLALAAISSLPLALDFAPPLAELASYLTASGPVGR
jgi:thioredoxin-related protein